MRHLCFSFPSIYRSPPINTTLSYCSLPVYIHFSLTIYPLLSFATPSLPKINDDRKEWHNLYHSLLFPSVKSFLPKPPPVLLLPLCMTNREGGDSLFYNPPYIPPPSICVFYSLSICLSLTSSVIFFLPEIDGKRFWSLSFLLPPPPKLHSSSVEIDE